MRARDPREYQVAVNLKNGDNYTQACRKAGYAETSVRHRAHAICKRESVKLLLLEISSGLKPGELGNMAKARIHEKLIKPPKEAKTALGYYRTALEIDAMIGGPSELHLHQHNELPKVVQEMLLAKMQEIQALKGEALDGTIVSEGTTSESENQKDHDGVQGRGAALGFQAGTAGEEPQPGDSHSS